MLGILLIAVVIALIYPFFAVNRPPGISDAAALVQDCQVLAEQHLSGELQIDTSNRRLSGGVIESELPQSIAALKPRGVYVKDDRVIILISTGGIDASFGYIVPYLTVTNFAHVGKRHQPVDGVNLSMTKHKNVYYWSGIE